MWLPTGTRAQGAPWPGLEAALLSLEPASFWQLSQEPLSNRHGLPRKRRTRWHGPTCPSPPAPWLGGVSAGKPRGLQRAQEIRSLPPSLLQQRREHPATKRSHVRGNPASPSRVQWTNPGKKHLQPSLLEMPLLPGRMRMPRSLRATENFSLPLFCFGFATPPVPFGLPQAAQQGLSLPSTPAAQGCSAEVPLIPTGTFPLTEHLRTLELFPGNLRRPKRHSRS